MRFLHYKRPKDNSIWLNEVSTIYAKSNLSNYDVEFFKSISSFCYYEETGPCKKGTYHLLGTRRDYSMSDAVEHSLKITKDIMLPLLNKAIDLNSCIEYFHRFDLSMQLYEDDFGNKCAGNFYNEGLLYIKNHWLQSGANRAIINPS